MYCINCHEETGNEYHFCGKCSSKMKNAKKYFLIGIISMVISLPFMVYSRFFIILFVVGSAEVIKCISDLTHFNKLNRHPERYKFEKSINDGELNEEALNRYLKNKSN